jgi:cysteine desulfurase
VLSGLEHAAVVAAGKLLEAEGFQVTSVAPTSAGVVDPAAVAAAVGEKTILVACLLVQNELGTIQPVAEIARAVRARRSEVHVHCDAVQALGKLAIDVRALGVDSLAVAAHKLHGPKGVGALWVKKGVRLAPLWGGSQQDGVRAGTENVAGIAGFGEAARLARTGADVGPLAARLVAGVQALRPDVIVNGADAPRVPHIVSLGFPGVPAEPLLHALEAQGVYVSAGSACAAKSKKPSGVLAAIGLSEDVGVLRFSLSRFTTERDVDAALAALPVALEQVSS